MSEDHNVQILGVTDDDGVHQTHDETGDALYDVYCAGCDTWLEHNVNLTDAEQIRDNHEKEDTDE